LRSVLTCSNGEKGEEGEDDGDKDDINDDIDDDSDMLLIVQSVKTLAMDWKIRDSFLGMVEFVPFATKSRLHYS
jgi:hypothetical protein